MFGSVTKDAQHFTQFSYDNSPQKGTIADTAIIRMMNPYKGVAVDFQLAWDKPYMGDYDLHAVQLARLNL